MSLRSPGRTSPATVMATDASIVSRPGSTAQTIVRDAW
jgi:hypothetical protein